MKEDKCQYNKIRGCDRPTFGDSDHCIYHMSDKNKIEAKLFYRKLKKEWTAGSRGEVIINDHGNEQRRWVFDRGLVWTGYEFPEVPSNESTDKGFFSFEWAIFKGEFNPRVANFDGIASFYGARFENGVSFLSASFDRHADFSRTRFKGETRFWGCEFNKGGTFNNSWFKDKVEFKGSRFGGNAFFIGTHFNDYTSFKSVNFEKTCNCRSAVFIGGLDFERASFGQGIKLVQNIEELKEVKYFDWEKEDLIPLRDKTEISEEIKALEKTRDLFYSYEFQVSGESNSTDTVELNLKSNPDIADKIDDAKDEIISINVRGEKFAKNEAKKEGCRVQRISYENEGKKEKADQVFVHEMRASRAKRIKDAKSDLKEKLEGLRGQELSTVEIAGRIFSFYWLGKLIGLLWAYLERPLADSTCLYGTSWGRVIGTSVGTMITFPFIYWFGSLINVGNIVRDGEIVASFGARLYYSVVTFTTLGYGDLEPVGGYMQAWSSIESVLGAFFIALLVLVFGRKWVRR